MGTLLQKADNKLYVQRMIALMYQRADISDVANREGLATAMGLVPNSLHHTFNVLYFKGCIKFRYLANDDLYFSFFVS